MEHKKERVIKGVSAKWRDNKRSEKKRCHGRQIKGKVASRNQR